MMSNIHMVFTWSSWAKKRGQNVKEYVSVSLIVSKLAWFAYLKSDDRANGRIGIRLRGK